MRICWKWPTFWKACNKQDTWGYWTCPGCNQQTSASDSVRTRNWSGDPQKHWDFDAGKRFQTICEIQENTTRQLMVIPTKDFAECFEQWKRHWEICVRSQGAYFEGDWGVIVLCTMFLVSYVFFNKCLYFSLCTAGYFPDRPHYQLSTFYQLWELMLWQNIIFRFKIA